MVITQTKSAEGDGVGIDLGATNQPNTQFQTSWEIKKNQTSANPKGIVTVGIADAISGQITTLPLLGGATLPENWEQQRSIKTPSIEKPSPVTLMVNFRDGWTGTLEVRNIKVTTYTE